MTDIPEELVERVARTICTGGGYGLCVGFCHRKRCTEAIAMYEMTARSAIRAVLDWQAKEWVEIPRLDRGGE